MTVHSPTVFYPANFFKVRVYFLVSFFLTFLKKKKTYTLYNNSTDISEDIAAHNTISTISATLPLADAPDVLLVDYGYEDISPCSSPTQYVCGQSDHSPPAECSPDRLYEPDQVPSSSYGPITSSDGTNFRVPGRGVKRLRDVYGEYDANNDNQLHYPDEGTLYLWYLFLSYHNILFIEF